MKIQCDVCNKNEASVYCSADEAALCSACDHRVHHANKLAEKHPRFSLLHPSPKDSPAVCDICQEKKAFLFCQQDRAILCKDCDLGIHKVNQHTQNHNRFLFTGVKLSPTASIYSSVTATATATVTVTPPATLSTTKNDVVPDQKLPSPIMNQTTTTTTLKTRNSHQELNGSGHGPTTSSISEYLIEMLPGWHVEDFLDPPPSLSKVVDDDPGLIWGGGFQDGSFNSCFPPESIGISVPQAPAAPPPPPSRYVQQFEPGSYIGFGDQTMNGSTVLFAENNYGYFNKNANSGTKSSRKSTSDYGNCFTVPQISPPSTTNKRSRTLWH